MFGRGKGDREQGNGRLRGSHTHWVRGPEDGILVLNGYLGDT